MFVKRPTKEVYYSMLSAASKRADLRGDGYNTILNLLKAEWPYLPTTFRG